MFTTKFSNFVILLILFLTITQTFSQNPKDTKKPADPKPDPKKQDPSKNPKNTTPSTALPNGSFHCSTALTAMCLQNFNAIIGQATSTPGTPLNKVKAATGFTHPETCPGKFPIQACCNRSVVAKISSKSASHGKYAPLCQKPPKDGQKPIPSTKPGSTPTNSKNPKGK